MDISDLKEWSDQARGRRSEAARVRAHMKLDEFRLGLINFLGKLRELFAVAQKRIIADSRGQAGVLVRNPISQRCQHPSDNFCIVFQLSTAFRHFYKVAQIDERAPKNRQLTPAAQSA
jgi:hypothetical protein